MEDSLCLIGGQCGDQEEELFDGGENAEIGIAVTLALGSRAMVAKEGFDKVCETSGVLSVDVDGQSRAIAVAVVDDG